MTGGLSTVTGAALYTKQALQAKKNVHTCFKFLYEKTGLAQNVVGRKGYGGDHSCVSEQKPAGPARRSTPSTQDISALTKEIDAYLTDSDESHSTSSSDSAPGTSTEPASSPRQSTSDKAHFETAKEQQQAETKSEKKQRRTKRKLSFDGEEARESSVKPTLVPSPLYIHFFYLCIIFIVYKWL